MRPSREFVEECLKLAAQFLEDAKRLLASGRLRSAVDRAYYAMFHAAQSILASKGFKPKTHAGLRELFGSEIVLKGLVEREYGRYLAEAFSMRQTSTYDVSTSLKEESVARLVDRAERFTARIKEMLRKDLPTVSNGNHSFRQHI